MRPPVLSSSEMSISKPEDSSPEVSRSTRWSLRRLDGEIRSACDSRACFVSRIRLKRCCRSYRLRERLLDADMAGGAGGVGGPEESMGERDMGLESGGGGINTGKVSLLRNDSPS